MQEIKHSDRYHELPADSESHIDIYKVECELPLLLNFYYVNEQETIPELDYGNVAIVNLKGHKTYTFNFKSDITTPTLSIEIFNPVKLPNVIIDDGQNENIVSKNNGKMLICGSYNGNYIDNFSLVDDELSAYKEFSIC